MMKKAVFETGRSMVEMLGTLAIIGVLSIGGIAGYKYGMDKHRANQTMNDINLRIVDLIAQASRGGELSLSEWPTKSTVGYDIALEKDVNTTQNTGGIAISVVSNSVCEMLGEMIEHSNITLKITGTEYVKGSCGEENTMVFFSEEVMKTPLCNGPMIDGECQPCGDGLVWNTTEEKCLCSNGCPENKPFLDSSGNCLSCPSDYLEQGCGCMTGCPVNTWWYRSGGPGHCTPCPEGSTSPGGNALECECETGTFRACTTNGNCTCDDSATIYCPDGGYGGQQ